MRLQCNFHAKTSDYFSIEAVFKLDSSWLPCSKNGDFRSCESQSRENATIVSNMRSHIKKNDVKRETYYELHIL